MSHNYGSNFYTAKELDHSSGHAFLSAGGDVFYSPNCSRRVDVPVPDDRYPFYVKESRFQLFLSPRWWQKPYHYFSFVPLRPRFDGIVFDSLREFVSDIGPVEGGFGLSPQKVKLWLELEDSLIVLSHLLNKGFFTRVQPGLTPIPASLLGFKTIFRTYRAACLGVAASRDWFLMWMSLISSKICDIETFQGDWFSYLSEKECPQDWLSGVQSSMVCDFSWHCPRVGTFLDIENPKDEQPSVEWFYSWNIPVWYRPGSSNPKHSYLQPPAHILQRATTFLTNSPSPSQAPSPSRAPSPSPPSPPRNSDQARKAYLATKPWEAFFAAREIARKRKLAIETPSDRAIRLNREKKHPTVSAEVFLWQWSLGDDIELVRTRVFKAEREDTLYAHPGGQSRYDPVFNCWDVCPYFVPDPRDPEGDDDSSDGGRDNDDMEVDVGPEIDRDAVETFVDKRIVQFNNHEQMGPFNNRNFALAVAPPSGEGPEVDLTHEANQIDVLQYMSNFYGFVPPLPIPATDPVPIRQGDWDESLKSVGLLPGIHPQLPGLTGPIVDFIKRLEGGGPRDFEWDVLSGNRQPLNRETIAKCFHKLNGFFFVDGSFLVDGSSTDWQIALVSSDNALYTLRYIQQSSELPSAATLARHLAEKGISFYTFLRLEHLPSSIDLNAFKTRIPRRGANYRFTPADFDLYVAERKQLLATPRARAAILQGGIVGRLAREHLEVDSVAFGPSSSVTVHRLGCSIEDEGAGVTYWDDGLTSDELAVICGLYCCYTGMFILLY